MTSIPLQLQLVVVTPDGGMAAQVVSLQVPVSDATLHHLSGRSPDLSVASTADLVAELARRLTPEPPVRDYDDLPAADSGDVEEGPREPELRYPRPESHRYTCRHGSREATPTTVFAGAIHTCRCCGLQYGSLNPEPADGLCEFCRSAEPPPPAPRPDPSDPLPF